MKLIVRTIIIRGIIRMDIFSMAGFCPDPDF
jgi:hypothetical protein